MSRTTHAYSTRAGLGLVPLLLLGLAAADRATAGAFDEPEDSPLFTASMQNAFREMAARDAVPRGASGPGSQLAPAQPLVIVVEGSRWHAVPAETMAAGRAAGAKGGRPAPMSSTVWGTFTCSDATTCSYYTLNSCGTCSMATCGGPTCDRGATCVPDTTCDMSVTVTRQCRPRRLSRSRNWAFGLG